MGSLSERRERARPGATFVAAKESWGYPKRLQKIGRFEVSDDDSAGSSSLIADKENSANLSIEDF